MNGSREWHLINGYTPYMCPFRCMTRKFVLMTISLIIAIFWLDVSSVVANAATVLVLSSGNVEQDATLSDVLSSHGHSVEIGPEYNRLSSAFDFEPFSTVLLQANYNWASNGGSDIPINGQSALLEFVDSGGGLITTEWFVWKNGAHQHFNTLYAAIPVESTPAFRDNSWRVTYNESTSDPILGRGIPSSFTFDAEGIQGHETRFVAKPGATVYYGSDYAGGEGVIGWDYGAGRVLSVSTLAGLASLADADYSLLIGNAASWVAASSELRGDFDTDGKLDVGDVDQLIHAIQVASDVAKFDLDGDGTVDVFDLDVWIRDIANTWFGDANLDGEFNSGDLVGVFRAGQYEDGLESNSTWGTGDWNGDGEFGSGDLVAAFEDGGFEVGPRTATQAIPEPSSHILFAFGACLLRRRCRRPRRSTLFS